MNGPTAPKLTGAAQAVGSTSTGSSEAKTDVPLADSAARQVGEICPMIE